MTSQTYGTITKAFHWTTALLILIIIPLGLIANQMPYDTNTELAQKAWTFSLHKTLGVTVFFVALLRIVWAISQPKPGPLHPDRKAETLLAEIIHWLLYISLVTAPLSGWIHHAATTGFAPIWWPLGQGLPLVPKDDSVAHLFGSMHWLLTKVMAASIFLHIAGALKHQFVDKDATLRRMWFGNGDVPATDAHDTPLAAPAIAIVVTVAAAVAGGVMGASSETKGPAGITLTQTQSDWVVQDGSLEITVKQLGTDITGSFADWTADITFDPDNGPNFGNVIVTVAIGSLTLGSVTDQAMGPDFFDTSQYPTATYTGDIIDEGDHFLVVGELTLKGTTSPLNLPFDLDLDGDTATMSGTIATDRMIFGIGQTMNDESNLGFAVAINAALTATRQR